MSKASRHSPVPTDDWTFLPAGSEVTHVDITSRAAALSSSHALSVAWDRSLVDNELNDAAETILEGGARYECPLPYSPTVLA